MAGLQSSDRTASFNSGGGGGGGVGSVGGSSVSMNSRPGSPRPNHTFGSLPRFPPSAVQGSKLASVLLLATSTPLGSLTLLVSLMVAGVLYHGQPVLRHREAEVIAQQARMQELAQARSAFYNAFPSAALPTTTTTSTAVAAAGGAGAATASTSVSPARVAQPTRSLRYGPGGAPGMSCVGRHMHVW